MDELTLAFALNDELLSLVSGGTHTYYMEGICYLSQRPCGIRNLDDVDCSFCPVYYEW